MSQVAREEISDAPALTGSLAQIHYRDTFRTLLPGDAPQTIDDLVRTIFLTAPRWVLHLLRLRNLLVRPFGLETEIDEAAIPRSGKLVQGSKLGMFHVFDRSDGQVLMGQDDTHLNYRVLARLQQAGTERYFLLTTAVQFNRPLGRWYFRLIRPFHKRIVPAMIRHGLKMYAPDTRSTSL